MKNLMNKILFAVHRAAPFPGGSEYYVQDMAEEMTLRGHDVTILAHEIQSNEYRGVTMTNDYNVLNQSWDMIIVHGGDVITQNIVHINADKIQSPILYMIIKPSESEICQLGMKHANYLSYSTYEDIEHIKKFGYMDKARRVRHGVDPNKTIAQKGQFRQSQILSKRLIVSAGGYYPHKRMIQLADFFNRMKYPDTILALFGYGDGEIPKDSDYVKVYKNTPKKVVMQAIADADVYIMNSSEEGFGLVLLEAMLNKTRWLSRNIAGAKMLSEYGNIFKNDRDLECSLYHIFIETKKDNTKAFNYAMANHTITQTVNDIEDIIKEK
jgi:glycosyltransferase involved in cell wall biosynthesis